MDILWRQQRLRDNRGVLSSTCELIRETWHTLVLQRITRETARRRFLQVGSTLCFCRSFENSEVYLKRFSNGRPSHFAAERWVIWVGAVNLSRQYTAKIAAMLLLWRILTENREYSRNLTIPRQNNPSYSCTFERAVLETGTGTSHKSLWKIPPYSERVLISIP